MVSSLSELNPWKVVSSHIFLLIKLNQQVGLPEATVHSFELLMESLASKGGMEIPGVDWLLFNCYLVGKDVVCSFEEHGDDFEPVVVEQGG